MQPLTHPELVELSLDRGDQALVDEFNRWPPRRSSLSSPAPLYPPTPPPAPHTHIHIHIHKHTCTHTNTHTHTHPPSDQPHLPASGSSSAAPLPSPTHCCPLLLRTAVTQHAPLDSRRTDQSDRRSAAATSWATPRMGAAWTSERRSLACTGRKSRPQTSWCSPARRSAQPKLLYALPASPQPPRRRRISVAQTCPTSVRSLSTLRGAARGRAQAKMTLILYISRSNNVS